MVIEIETKSVYGTVKFYPANEAAKTLAAIAGKTTLTVRDIQLARKLGHTVEEKHINHLEHV